MLRKRGLEMFQKQLDVGQIPDVGLLSGLCRDCEKPDVQMLILARLAGMAIGDDAKTAMAATGMLMEITGCDVRSQLAQMQHELDMAKLELDREKMQPRGADLSKVDAMMDVMNAEAGAVQDKPASAEP